MAKGRSGYYIPYFFPVPLFLPPHLAEIFMAKTHMTTLQVLRAMIVAASRPQDVATAALLGTSELVKQERRDGKVNRSNISNGDLI